MKSTKVWAALCMVGTLLATSQAEAANHYVRAGASGAASGADWTNAWTALPSVLQRGDTYYVADGQYGGVTLDDAVAGTQTIVIRKATVADHGTDVGWDDSYGDGQAVFTSGLNIVTGYYILDGQVRGADWKTGYGFCIDGSAGKGINIGSSSTTAHHVTVRYVEIMGRGRDGAGSPANDLVYILPPVTHFTMQYCYLHDAGRTAFLLRAADDGLIEYCHVARNESTTEQHSEAISASGTDRWTIRYNYWEDIEGTGIIVFVGDGWELYGNVCYETGTPPYGGISNGSFCTWTGEAVTNSRLHNNTCVRLTGLNSGFRFDAAHASGNVAYNNLWYDCEKAGLTGVAADYNLLIATAFSYGTTAQPHDVVITQDVDPFVDSEHWDFRLSGATAAGLTLAAPFTSDMSGAARGADGTWDRGAFEYVEGAAGVERWSIVARHGGADVISVIGEGYIEPRKAGVEKLRVTLAAPLDPATVSRDVVTLTGAVSGDQSDLVSSVALDGDRTLVITLASALPAGEWFTVGLTEALRFEGGAALGGDRDIRLGGLPGDVNGSGTVTVADVLAVRGMAGQAAAGETASFDLDGSGSVTAGDMQAVHRHLGSHLP